jgi:molybdate transport system substrate-binding protein
LANHGTLAAVCLALALLTGGCGERRPADRQALRLLCGVGLKPALDELLPAFTEETGIPVEPDYAGSGIILTRARQEGAADLFLPGDRFYVEELQRLSGRVADCIEIATLSPCIIVAKGNPKKIAALRDFARQDVRVAVGNAEACQVGRLTATLLAKAGVEARTLNAKEGLTVNELGLWVKLRDVDAAVVWDATAAALGATVDTVAIPLDPTSISRVALALLADARDPNLARDFMTFCRQPLARSILRRKGYCVDTPAEARPPTAPEGGRP